MLEGAALEQAQSIHGPEVGCREVGLNWEQLVSKAKEGTLTDSISSLLAQLNEKGRMIQKVFSTSSLLFLLLGCSPTDSFPQQRSSRGDSHTWR